MSFPVFMLLFGYIAIGFYFAFKALFQVAEEYIFKTKHLLVVLIFPIHSVAVVLIYFALFLVFYIKEQDMTIEFLEKEIFKKKRD